MTDHIAGKYGVYVLTEGNEAEHIKIHGLFLSLDSAMASAETREPNAIFQWMETDGVYHPIQYLDGPIMTYTIKVYPLNVKPIELEEI